MENHYFSRRNTGGANLSSGIGYQDNVGLLYLFKNIDKAEFKYITFETYDDFTIIYESYELCVQVKKTPFSFSSVKDILSKGYNEKYEDTEKKYKLISSLSDSNFSELLNKLEQFQNERKTYRTNQEILDIENKFKQIVIKTGIDYEKFMRIEFEIIPLDYIAEAIKFNMYKWAEGNKLQVEIDDLFDKLTAKISNYLRTKRGALNYNDIEIIARKCTKKNNEVIKRQHFYDSSTSSIIIALNRDIDEQKHFSDKLKFIKLYIETYNYDEAQKLAEEIYPFNDNFKYYHIWVLYKLGKQTDIMNICDNLIKENKCMYYALYYKGTVLLEAKEYEQAIDCLLHANQIQNTYDVNLKIGKLYQIAEKRDESLKHYNCCLQLDNTDANLYLEMSNLLPDTKAIEYLDNAIRLDPNLYKAYFQKGKILRYYGMSQDAYKYFNKYLEHKKDDIECFKEISLCLLNMNDDKAHYYLNDWLKEIIFTEDFSLIQDGKSICIVDVMWNKIQNIICVKQDEDFIIITPISEYILHSSSNNEIGIGYITDGFIKMSKEFFKKHGSIIEVGEEFIPCITKLYSTKKEFNKIFSKIQIDNSIKLNKDYNIELGNNQTSRFREYIDTKNVTSIIIDEFLNDMHVKVTIGKIVITGWFKKDGEGYFVFRSKIENPSGFSEAVVVLGCIEPREEVHIKFDIGNIKIKKSVVYDRENYVGDIVLPLD
ncbi:tetratricopeptide repeat protein [Clostridium estertheticum]|uniref:tetratricopeptide repeat protein n=1 Tax=Clostridium estertheticum TaxID=238834 RepID=UPI001CF19DC7|nr:hypothetical protein [Clostridium estertheticum]MCB2354407.1 hypothetical protein [Clostridium estertheticum]WAG42476.1 hypothetical protein LL065_07320 [Clostridium estertheticum]